MIKNTKHKLSIGHIVQVGFLKLRIINIRAVYEDIYEMESLDSKTKYEFIPHDGLHRIN